MENSKKKTKPLQKLSIGNIKRRFSLETSPPNFYVTVPDDEGCLINSEPVSSKEDLVINNNDSSSSSVCENSIPIIKNKWPNAGHSRSQSDGCFSIHQNAANLSTQSHLKQTSVLHGSPQSTNIFTEGIFTSSLNANTSNSEENNLYSTSPNETEEELQNAFSAASYGSRYPLPKPGESLMSFLTSANLYKNCGALERENAHFYIAEALMGAFEQVC